MNIKNLIDEAKHESRLYTDRKLCDRLNVSHSAVHHWKTGKVNPSIEHIQALAELANKDPAPIILEYLETTAKNQNVKETITRLKKLLTAATISLVCILCKIQKGNKTITVQI